MSARLQLEIFANLVNKLRLGHNYRSIVTVSEIYSDVIRTVALIFKLEIELFQLLYGFINFLRVRVKEDHITNIEDDEVIFVKDTFVYLILFEV